ncbi:hypothetical protein FSP39_016438 [Pinctada imbricata]|uniref:Uncharacterized protein n=1 Tax=Pinctada imbricata TaxID=66713 RepID=A0AA88XSG3_PINIB|nr:hypothetical protein FSP39_016438 [Pinctada imbricata]
MSSENNSLELSAKRHREGSFIDSADSSMQNSDSSRGSNPLPPGVYPSTSAGLPSLPYVMHPQYMSSPVPGFHPSTAPQSSISDLDIQRIAAVLKGQIVSEVYNAFQQHFDEMKATIDTLSAQNKVLTQKVDDLEMYSRRSCIRITGIPEEKPQVDQDGKEVKVDENTTGKIVELARLIDVSVTEDDIEVSHRINRKDGSRDRPRQIIARIKNNVKRHALISNSYKLAKFPAKKGTYICQELTKARSKVAYEARQLVREKKD